MPSRPTRMRATNCSAVSAAKLASKVSTSAPFSPVAASRRSFDVSSVRRNTGSDGRNTFRGCGSNVIAIAGASSAPARARAASITARWPRCTPSKLPIAATAPLNCATRGELSRATTNGLVDLGGVVIGKDACASATLWCSAPRSQPLTAGRAGTETIASPSSTSLPSTLASHCSRTMRPLAVNSTTSTMTSTTSPIFTGPWKFSVCER